MKIKLGRGKYLLSVALSSVNSPETCTLQKQPYTHTHKYIYRHAQGFRLIYLFFHGQLVSMVNAKSLNFKVSLAKMFEGLLQQDYLQACQRLAY